MTRRDIPDAQRIDYLEGKVRALTALVATLAMRVDPKIIDSTLAAIAAAKKGAGDTPTPFEHGFSSLEEILTIARHAADGKLADNDPLETE